MSRDISEGGPQSARVSQAQPSTSGAQPVGVALMVASALLVCFGQLLWKLGATHGWLLVLAGLVLYGLGAVLMLVAYRFGEVSVLQPILGLSYVLSLALGAIWLGEQVTAARLAGVLAISAGVALLASGPREAVA